MVSNDTHFDGRNINWNRVYQFSEVADCGSIKTAASRLGLSPSTLSEHISALENELSVKLFIREHRRLTLTDAGARLALKAKQLFEASQRLIDVVSPVPLGTYPIAVGLVPGPSMALTHRIIADYLAASGPLDARFSLATHEDLEDGLLKARYDFGFSSQLPLHKSLEFQEVTASALGFYVAKLLAPRGFVELVRDLPILVCMPPSQVRELNEKLLQIGDLTPRAIINSEQPELLLDLCVRGQGIALLNVEHIAQLEASGLEEIAPCINLSGNVKNPDHRIAQKLYALWLREGRHSAALLHLQAILGLLIPTASFA